MKTVEDLTELNKIKLNQLFKYINNYIFQAIRRKNISIVLIIRRILDVIYIRLVVDVA